MRGMQSPKTMLENKLAEEGYSVVYLKAPATVVTTAIVDPKKHEVRVHLPSFPFYGDMLTVLRDALAAIEARKDNAPGSKSVARKP